MKKIPLLLFLVLFLISCEKKGCISGDCTNGFGTYTYANGDKYVGEWKEHKQNGQGTFTFTNGNKLVKV